MAVAAAARRSFSSLDDILNECTNGLWTLVVSAGDPSEQVFHFSVAISGLTSNVLVSVPIFSPATGAIVSPHSRLPMVWSHELSGSHRHKTK